ncbi:MAG TPA: serine hydrolase [Bacteroidales bacterium]|nr:serine hydrolase [Bacteroidales bacterium]
MNILKKGIILSSLAFTLNSCYFGRMVVYNVADVNDYKKFPQLLIHTKDPQPLKTNYISPSDNWFSPDFILKKNKNKFKNTHTFIDMLQVSKTNAFLILKHDTIIYEYYAPGYDASSIHTSFSANKSIIALLLGIAIDEGYINSVDDPITKYISDFEDKNMSKVTLRHLLDMRSGLKFDENYYNPFAEIGKYYYGKNLKKKIRKLKLIKEPGGEYNYQSVNTLLLGLAIENATGTSLYQYYENKLWQPLHMEYDATLNVDDTKNLTAKAFCGLNARARDYAKIGLVCLNKGNYMGNQVIPEKWINEIINVEQPTDGEISYHHHWRVDADGNLMAVGLLGQYIFISYKNDLVIVRLGAMEGDINWKGYMRYLANII